MLQVQISLASWYQLIHVLDLDRYHGVLETTRRLVWSDGDIPTRLAVVALAMMYKSHYLRTTTEV